jgi:sulfur carrier protein
MSSLIVNGQPYPAPNPVSIADVVEDILGVRVAADGSVPHGARLGVAVAVNAVVVPRTGWAARQLAVGDAVEIVTATQGG